MGRARLVLTCSCLFLLFFSKSLGKPPPPQTVCLLLNLHYYFLHFRSNQACILQYDYYEALPLRIKPTGHPETEEQTSEISSDNELEVPEISRPSQVGIDDFAESGFYNSSRFMSN